MLGPTVAEQEASPVGLRPRERDVLAALALHAPKAVSLSEIAASLWPDGVPPSAEITIQNHIARVRRRLGSESVTTLPGGYRLGAVWTIDLDRRAELVHTAARWSRLYRPDLAVRALDEATALSRGPAYTDLAATDGVVTARDRQLEMGKRVVDELLVALAATGSNARVIADGPAWCQSEPFREVRWAVVAVALYRDGQRRESARLLHRAGRVLRERAGLSLGPALRRLEEMVLDDDSELRSAPIAELVGRADARPSAAGLSAAPPTHRHAGGPSRDDPEVGLAALPAQDLSFGALASAAEVATQCGQFEEAAQLWKVATERSIERRGETHATTLRYRLHHAQALRLAGDPTCSREVMWVVDRAEAVSGDLFAEAVTEMCRLGPSTVAGQLDTSRAQILERAVNGCQQEGIRASCESEAALFYSMTGRLDRAVHHYEQSIRDARRSQQPRALLDALGATYVIVTHPRDQGRRQELAAEMLELAERLDDDNGRFSALHLYFATQVIDADPLLRTTFRHQEQLARRLGTAGRRWMATYQRACVAFLDGRLDDALEITEDAFATAPVSTSRAGSTRSMMLLMVRSAQGREQELTEHLDAVIAEQPALPGWRTVAAWLAARRGDRDRVVEELRALDHGRSIPEDMSWGPAICLLGRAAARVGHLEAAEPILGMLRPYAGTFSWYGSGTVGPFDLALADLTLALGDRAGALGYIDSAERLVRRLGAVVFQPEIDEARSRLLAG